MRLKRYLDVLGYYSYFFKPEISLLRKASNFARYYLSSKGVQCRSMPISAQIEPTLRCNLRCTMCVREHFKQGDMSFQDFRRVVDQLDSLIKIHLQGLGEPFLNREIFSMIDYAASRNIMVSVITNGTIFSDEVIGRIAK